MNKLHVEPFNRDSASSFEKKFMLPAGTMKYIFLNKVSDLLSRDENLMKYRLYVDNFPTTDRDVIVGNALGMTTASSGCYFGADLRAWNEAIVVPELNLNWQSSPSPDGRASGNERPVSIICRQSIIYLYSLVFSRK
jgi:hypothetical protein